MKRFWPCIIITVFCVLSITNIVKCDEPLHELWGVPFGCSPEECIDRIYESRGIILEPVFGDVPILSQKKTQNVEFLDIPVDAIVVHFTNSELYKISISMHGERFSTRLTPEEAKVFTLVSQYEEVVNAFTVQYGDMTGYVFSVDTKGTQERFCFENDTIDYNAVTHVLINNIGSYVTISFNNIDVSLACVETSFAEVEYYVSIIYRNYGFPHVTGDFPIYRYEPIKDVKTGF